MSKRILILDDDEVFANTLKRSLGHRGIESFVATTIDEAESILLREQPENIVVDLKIDRESGLHFLPFIRDNAPEARALILTGYSSIRTTVEAMKLGSVNYLCKPATTDEILAAFEEIEARPDIPIADQPPSVNRMEWEHIQRVLADNDGNISATAAALGMHRRTLQRKLQKRPVSR